MKVKTLDPHLVNGDKVERIFRILLSRKTSNLTWYRIAKEADVSYSWAYRTLKELEGDGLIADGKLKDTKGLFMKWAGRKDHRVFREYHMQDPESVLKNSGMDYSLTGYFAENLIGHYLFPRYREIYIRWEDAMKWHSYLTGNGYVGKGNLRVILSDEHVFFERDEVQGWPVVSIQQLIVDLYRTGSECAEAADNLVRRAYL
ncbi:MAG: hypothetical protein ABR986_10615 [Methanomassiliicoccales archaeon]